MTGIPEIVATSDGSQTLRHHITGETYHSVNGAVAESMHVFIHNGFEAHPARHVRILEAGFGSGLNALLTLHAAENTGRSVEYTAIELYPLGPEIVREMDYASDPLFVKMHDTPWNGKYDITEWFSLTKIDGDLADTQFTTIFDIVYYDAFAPDSQPELWTEEIFRRIYDALAPGGILVTYSAKGDVKRALRAAGFTVSRLEGAPGKRHMLRAVKTE
jgi:tRNA U34 5-methylaminomethyl-2-thiouridine-forming methyltransferase MnmC